MDTINKILIPEDFAVGTRFPLPQLSKDAFERTKVLLINEFANSSAKIINKNEYCKLYIDNKIVEINKDYVIFIPRLNKNTAEDIRKKIFKHIANKPQMYRRTSMDNWYLSKKALVEGDLRVSVSLLYYSIHKAITSIQHSVLQDDFSLFTIEDRRFDELGHFTDHIFYHDYDCINEFLIEYQNIKEKQDLKALSKIFSRHSRFGVNPYRMIAVALEKIEFENIDIYSQSLIYLAKTILNTIRPNIDLESKEILSVIDEIIETQYDETKASNGSTANQENRVNIAILKCIVEGMKTDNPKLKARNYIYAVLVRLYWLRQIGDYAFDFEVKVTYRELGVLSLLCEDFLDKLFRTEKVNVSLPNLTNTIETEKEIAEISRNEDDLNSNELKTERDSNYSDIIELIECDISKTIPPLKEGYIFTKVVWEDANLEAEKLLFSIYNLENVHSDKDMLVYNIQGLNSNISNITISILNDCVIFFKILIKEINIDLYTLQECKFVVNEFIQKLITSYCKTCSCEYNGLKILISSPNYSSKMGNNSFENIIHSAIEYNRQLTNKYELLNIYLLERLNLILKEDKYVGLYKKTNLVQQVSICPASFYKKERNLVFTFNIEIITGLSNLFKLRDDIHILRSVKNHFSHIEEIFNVSFVVIIYSERHLGKIITKSAIEKYLEISFDEENEEIRKLSINNIKIIPLIFYIEEENYEISSDDLKDAIVEELNTIAYNLIAYEGEFDISNRLLCSCEILKDDIFILATLGLWHFRNNNLQKDDRISKGTDYYERAIQLASQTDFEHKVSLIQKYYYELSKCKIEYNEFEEAYAILISPECDTNTGAFIKDVKELMRLLENIFDGVDNTTVEKSALNE